MFFFIAAMRPMGPIMGGPPMGGAPMGMRPGPLLAGPMPPRPIRNWSCDLD
jgi:hypothetical protein